MPEVTMIEMVSYYIFLSVSFFLRFIRLNVRHEHFSCSSHMRWTTVNVLSIASSYIWSSIFDKLLRERGLSHWTKFPFILMIIVIRIWVNLSKKSLHINEYSKHIPSSVSRASQVRALRSLKLRHSDIVMQKW